MGKKNYRLRLSDKLLILRWEFFKNLMERSERITFCYETERSVSIWFQLRFTMQMKLIMKMALEGTKFNDARQEQNYNSAKISRIKKKLLVFHHIVASLLVPGRGMSKIPPGEFIFLANRQLSRLNK